MHQYQNRYNCRVGRSQLVHQTTAIKILPFPGTLARHHFYALVTAAATTEVRCCQSGFRIVGGFGMEADDQIVQRRMRRILDDIAVSNELSSTASSSPYLLFPMLRSIPTLTQQSYCISNQYHCIDLAGIFFCFLCCSSCGCFHFDGRDTLQISSTLNSWTRRYDNKLLFARQVSSSQGCFMRQVSSDQVDSSRENSEGPLFGRPSLAVSNLSNESKKQDEMSSTSHPVFARSRSSMTEKTPFFSDRTALNPSPSGIKWFPKMDVAESRSPVVTIELPSVSIIDIRVEVDNQNLIVTGERSTERWILANGFEKSSLTYHRREILHGPYNVVWPIPSNVNEDDISAEFVDGFLRITLPKL